MPKTQGGLPLIPLLSGFLGGLLVCLAIASLTNRNEAWDADLYYSTGIPVMCLIIFVLSFVFPEKPWRWTIAMAAGQFASALINGSSLSLWPLALIFMTVISIPQFVSGFLAAKLALRYRNQA